MKVSPILETIETDVSSQLVSIAKTLTIFGSTCSILIVISYLIHYKELKIATYEILFSIITSVFLFLGITPIALAANGPALNADRASTEYTASALTKCSENPKFIERANSATTQKDIARFERYGKASCGDDGLPHLIIGPPLEPWGALLNRGHEGDLLIPGVLFIYIAGIIGWSGREYLIESKKTKNPADLEIIIDLDLARKCLVKGAQWPLLANKQGRNGDLREKDNNITLNGPR